MNAWRFVDAHGVSEGDADSEGSGSAGVGDPSVGVGSDEGAADDGAAAAVGEEVRIG